MANVEAQLLTSFIDTVSQGTGFVTYDIHGFFDIIDVTLELFLVHQIKRFTIDQIGLGLLNKIF